MSGWVLRASKVHVGHGGPLLVEMDEFAGSPHARFALPSAVSRRRVEGGAPYLHEHDLHGTPPYPVDMLDTPLTHPLADDSLIVHPHLQSFIFPLSKPHTRPSLEYPPGLAHACDPRRTCHAG